MSGDLTGARGPRWRPRVAHLLSDVRALGPLAGLRAGYEASKVLGGHRLVFGGLAALARQPAGQGRPIRALPGWSRRPPVHPAAARRAVIEAERIVAGEVEVFGRTCRVGPIPDWEATLLAGDASWPHRRWWRIDLRSETRTADVKWTWELGRHRHLVVLARAAALSGGQAAFLPSLEAQLRSWFAAAPPETGVHWYSNLELALRSLRWLEVLHLVGDRLDVGLHRSMAAHLAHTARHLAADLPYTVSTMRNNHLLGDGLGLIGLGGALDRDRTASLGRRCFDAQLARHMQPDGSMIEDSLSYHRFVLEMLVARTLIDDEPAAHQALETSSQFLCRLGALEGELPQYGDWDEGRVLTATGGTGRVAGAALAGLALAGDGAPEQWHAEHDEVAWYAPVGEPVAPEPAERDGHHVGGGIARAERGRFAVWLKAGGRFSHTHADRTSVAIRFADRWVVGDPGTGTYNGSIEQRNHFRTAAAHDVLRLDGQDQLVPHRAFRWEHRAVGVVGPPLRSPGAVLLWGAHDAYRRLEPGRRVARTVLLRPDGVLVSDWVEGAPGVPWSLALPLGPAVRYGDRHLDVPGAGPLRVALPAPPVVHHGEHEPFDGWWSPTYGSVQPSTRLAMQGVTDGPIWWWIGETAPQIDVDADGVRCDGIVHRVEWSDAGAVLGTTLGGADRSAFLRLR